MRPPYILIFVGYACFGVGMLLGQALGNSVWWIVATVIVGLACMLMLIPFHRTPAKKKLPVRRASRQQIKRKA
ncbi:MAG TPA: hypothetical protein VHV10_20610 [Ktedonobacteraceae bacterium]|nr:hypothetical protein [Ktedonobacteraceae bacterium]